MFKAAKKATYWTGLNSSAAIGPCIVFGAWALMICSAALAVVYGNREHIREVNTDLQSNMDMLMHSYKCCQHLRCLWRRLCVQPTQKHKSGFTLRCQHHLFCPCFRSISTTWIHFFLVKSRFSLILSLFPLSPWPFWLQQRFLCPWCSDHGPPLSVLSALSGVVIS